MGIIKIVRGDKTIRKLTYDNETLDWARKYLDPEAEAKDLFNFGSKTFKEFNKRMLGLASGVRKPKGTKEYPRGDRTGRCVKCGANINPKYKVCYKCYRKRR